MEQLHLLLYTQYALLQYLEGEINFRCSLEKGYVHDISCIERFGSGFTVRMNGWILDTG